MFISPSFAPEFKMATEHEIFTKAESLFFKYGIKSITMDDLSRELGISKKTLYQFVENKDDLVFKVMQYHLQREMDTLKVIIEKSENALEEFAHMVRGINVQMREMNPTVLYDLRKFHAKTWNLFNEYKEEFIMNYITLNLRNGQQQGYYRKDINLQIIASIYIRNIDIMVDLAGTHGSMHHFVEVYREMVVYHLRGIASEKGLEYIEKHLKL